MEPVPARPRHEAVDARRCSWHEWRVRQLTGLGIPWSLAHGRCRPRRLAPGRQAGAPRLPATAGAPDRPVRQSPWPSSLPVQRLTERCIAGPGRQAPAERRPAAALRIYLRLRARGRHHLRVAQRGPPARGARHRRGGGERGGAARPYTGASWPVFLIIPPSAKVPIPGMLAEEMDPGAVLARGPAVALASDDFAHRNAPGSRHRARWQDVEDLLAAGIDVISAVSGRAPGFPGRRGGEDHRRPRPGRPCPIRSSGRRARSSCASTWRRRPCGTGWPAATSTRRRPAEAALGGWFRTGNLSALRELALLWLAAAPGAAARAAPSRQRRSRQRSGPGAGGGRAQRRPGGRGC